MPPSVTSAHDDLPRRLEDVIALLGYGETNGLVRQWLGFRSCTNRHVVRQAFDAIRVRAVFGFRSRRHDAEKFSPVLYLATASNEAEANTVHKLVWSQGLVPILLIATPSGLQIRRSLGPSSARPAVVPWDKLRGGLPTELASLTAVALSSSIVWRDFISDRSNRVDAALLKAIKALNTAVRQESTQLHDQAALVNALIGRFIYFFVLLDRKIVTKSWIAGLRDHLGKPCCAQIAQSIDAEGHIDIADRPWPAKEVWALFDKIDDVLNGAIFPISITQRRLISVDALHLVRRAIRHGDTLGAGARQLGFLDVSFSTLRTETISAIYELFLFIENPDEKDEEGAFYTPPFLVDYVLDEVDRIRAFTAKSRVLDPAAGSGIFLVGAYRRILEREMPKRTWMPPHFQKARLLLEKSIFAIEKNGQAANVARFSLYLTLLDYAENASIRELKKLAGGRRAFPCLDANVFNRDLFSISGTALSDVGRFTHIVGNPPWGSYGEQTGRSNEPRSDAGTKQRNKRLEAARAFAAELDEKTHPVGNTRLSELFVWKVQRDLLQKGGVFGLLISTRSYVAPSADAFPRALAKNVKLFGLANLSHFRYRLFKGARSPALAIFAENATPNPLDKVWVYSPLLTSQPIGEAGHLWSIVVADNEIEPYKLRDLTQSSESWFWALMLRPIDRRYANQLRLWSQHYKRTFGEFLSGSKLIMSRGGSASQTGIPSNLLLTAENYAARLGFQGMAFSDYPHDRVKALVPKGNFARLFSGNIVFIPRHMNEVRFVDQPIAFVSTFNALAAEDGRQLDAPSIAAMKGIARYLSSDVARYLYALFGKTRILDRARLEKGDLESIPFPFTGLGDFALQRLAALDEPSITRLFAEKVALDATFVQAVSEYNEFRLGYEDAQVPASALSAPEERTVGHYKAMLLDCLSDHFGVPELLMLAVQRPAPTDHFALVTVRIGGANERLSQAEIAQMIGHLRETLTFSPYSHLFYDARTSTVALAKPWTRVAWTVEQAFADARGVSEEVLRLEVAA